MTHSEWINLSEQLAAHCRRAQDALQRSGDSILADRPEESRITYVIGQANIARGYVLALLRQAKEVRKGLGLLSAPSAGELSSGSANAQTSPSEEG